MSYHRAETDSDTAFEPDLAGEIDTLTDRVREAACAYLNRHDPPSDDAELAAAFLAIMSAVVDEGLAGIVAREKQNAVAATIAEVLDDSRPSLAMWCYAFAAGLAQIQGVSETEIARRFNVRRATISKRVVSICDRLGFQPSRGMKSRPSRDTYSTVQRRAWCLVRGRTIKKD